MLVWILLKSLLGNIFAGSLRVVAFIIERWRIFLPLVILGAILLYVHSVTVQRDEAVATFAKHLADDKAASEKRAEYLAKTKAEGLAEVDNIKNSYQNQIADIIQNSQAKESNYAEVKIIDERSVANYRDGLRLAIQREETARLSGNDQDRSAGDDYDATLARREVENETLRKGGAWCAADYNQCKAYVDSEQRRIGVEK